MTPALQYEWQNQLASHPANKPVQEYTAHTTEARDRDMCIDPRPRVELSDERADTHAERVRAGYRQRRPQQQQKTLLFEPEEISAVVCTNIPNSLRPPVLLLLVTGEALIGPPASCQAGSVGAPVGKTTLRGNKAEERPISKVQERQQRTKKGDFRRDSRTHAGGRRRHPSHPPTQMYAR